MNYYRRYMGDYLNKTASLTMLEHGAYTLLLDYSYLAGGRLTGDIPEICRLVRAATAAERMAVSRILATFFQRDGNSHSNQRVLTEVEKARPAIEAAKTNGVKGGRPKNNPVGSEYETQHEPTPKASQPPTTNHLTTNPQPPSASLQPPEVKTLSSAASRTLAPKGRSNGKEAKSGPAWISYSSAYCARYGTEPVRNAKVNTHLAKLVDRLGAEEAPHVAAFYVSHSSPFYVRDMHGTGLLERDAEKLRTEWATGRRMTTAEARNAEHGDAVRSQADRVGKLLEGA